MPDAHGAGSPLGPSGMLALRTMAMPADTNPSGDIFGGSVAVSGDTVVVGAWGEDSSTTGVNSTPDESATHAGAAYVFTVLPVPSISRITSVNPFQFQFDGGSRGNPGPAGIGVVVSAADGTPLVTLGRFIGRATNNVAEYRALITAMAEALKLGAKRVLIRGDSGAGLGASHQTGWTALVANLINELRE